MIENPDSETVKVLSESAQRELGGDNVMFVVAFDSEGNQTVYRPAKVTASKVTFPEAVREVHRIDPISVVSVVQNPRCCYWVSGGTQYKFCW